MNRMSIACTPPKLGSQWGLRYLSLQTTGQHCLSVELIAHPDDLCIKREISKAVSYIHLNSNRLLQHIWGPCYFLGQGMLSSKKTRENLRIFSNRPALIRQEAEDTVSHKKSAFPLHSFTWKDKQRRTLCVHFVFPRTYWEYLSSSHYHHHRYRHWWGWGHQANTALPVYIVVFTDTFDPKVYVHLLIAVQK